MLSASALHKIVSPTGKSKSPQSSSYLSAGVAFAEACGRRLRGFGLGFLVSVESGGVSSAACFVGAGDAVADDDAEVFSDLLPFGAVSLNLIFKAGCAIVECLGGRRSANCLYRTAFQSSLWPDSNAFADQFRFHDVQSTT